MITDDLHSLSDLIPKDSVVVLHVGLRGLYDNSLDYSHQALMLLDEIRKYISPREIYVPTFTYNFTKSKIFDVRDTPAEVGRFSDEIRKNCELGIKRNLDPIFSIIETEVKRSEHKSLIKSAFGKNSIWNYLDGINHFILNINLPQDIISTQIHHFEYTQNVPYRYKKIFVGDVIDWGRERRKIRYEYFVRDLSRGVKWNRNKIVKLAASCGGLIKTSTVSSFDWQVLKKSLIKELSKDIEYLIN